MRSIQLLLSLFLVISISNADEDWGIIFAGNCASCHKDGNDKTAAPPVVALKQHYKAIYPKKEDFVANMSKWLVDPNKENSLMQGAIRKFGLMPNVGIDLETAKGLAGFLYDNEFFKPEWFDSHYQQNHKVQ
jgi:hypothetical protein